MKTLLPSIISLSIFPFFVYGQVGINTDTPLTALEVKAADPNNHTPTEGIIVPRVTSLNMTDSKPKGLLVFLDAEDPTTPAIERGFYWWNGTEWKPFFSMNKIKRDETITYVSAQNIFREGNIDNNLVTTRTIPFAASNLVAGDPANFEINANNELVVKKAGKYHIVAIFSLNYSQVTNNRRDSFEGTILVNNTTTNPILTAAYGFPSSLTEFNNSFTVSGVLRLNANDRINLQINRYYADSGNVTIRPNGSQTNVTLRYMGPL